MNRFAIVFGVLVSSISSLAELRVTDLRCEFRNSPIGVDAPHPRLSWTLLPTGVVTRGLRQAAYEIRVATQPGLLESDQADLWSSGRVISDQTAHLAYDGKPLVAYQQCWWSVRVWDQSGAESLRSQPASWTMGMLARQDWEAKWVSAAQGNDKSGPLPLFRREFGLAKPVRRALVSICGLGFYELSINGRKVGDLVLDPGWTDYRKRCLYTTYDVTDQLRQDGPDPRGGMALGVMLGNGMYNVRGGRYVKFTGSLGPPQFILQMRVEFTDGSSTNLVSDETWKTSSGPITFSCIYGGEDYDARREPLGWNQPGFVDSTWDHVRMTEGPGGRLVAQSAPPLQVMEIIKTTRVTEPKPGVFVYDLGRNFSGWPQITVRGPAGASVKLIPGELLDEHGFVSQRSSGQPVSFSYTLSGRSDSGERWHPRFSYSGFRYIEVEGAVPVDHAATAASPVVLMELGGQFIHSAARRTGEFTSSSALLNQTHHLILAAIESNLQSVLTDCPHREKLGWLEVSHLLGPAIMFNYDVPLLYRKICDDMADAQLPSGLVPDIAPEYTVFSGGFRDSPEWGSACVINPWLLYQRYGDRHVLEAQYPAMSRYVRYLAGLAQEHILSHGLGDWYDIGPKPPGESQLTSKGITATAFLFHDLNLLRRTADLLGKKDEAERWAGLAENVRRAFNAKFFNATARTYDRGSQTAQAMPLVLGLVDQDQAATVLQNLVQAVRSHGNQVTAGDVGFRFLVEALRTGGRSDVLFDAITRHDGPGYADQLRKGATTLTEAWDANPASSQNHCMLGHAEEWFYSGLAGINPDPAAPGFKQFLIQPQPVGGIASVRASYDSIQGRISSAWTRSGKTFTLEVGIPPNTRATVTVPADGPEIVTENGTPVRSVESIRLLGFSDGMLALEVESGNYRFVSRMK